MGASNAGVEGINRDRRQLAGYRSMMCCTCEQQLRQSAVHLRRRISESIFIAACSVHDYEECRSECNVKSEAELA